MGDIGLKRFLGLGLRFATSAVAGTYVGLKLATDPIASFYLNLPTALPGGVQAITVDASGNMGFAALGGGGTVTSVGLSLPALFTVTNTPVTTTGTLTATLANQAANTFLGGPVTGVAVPPAFRGLIAGDIPQTLTSSWITNFDTQVRTNRLDQMAAPTTTVNLNSQRIIGLLNPVGSQDAATKSYADALISTGNNKGSVRAASTINISLATPGALIDGVTLVLNDLILLKDQTAGSQNGIYLWTSATATLTRATNADISAEVRAGLFLFVSEGTVNGNNGYTLTTDDPIVLGTTALVFTQFSGAGQITAGGGLTKNGNQLDIGSGAGITVNPDDIQISATYAGQASISILGAVTTGTWNGTEIAVAKGGTGATTAAAARANLGAPGVYRLSFTNTDLTAGVLNIPHGLGNRIVNVQVGDSSGKVCYPEITWINTTTASADFSDFGTLPGTYDLIVVG